MLIEAKQLVDGPSEAEICIVGGGAIGLCLAARLSELGHDVLLLEAGGLKPAAESQAFYAGDVADPRVHWPLDSYRVRALGGTSLIWGGRAVPYDPIDFAQRHWVPLSGWPIAYADVARYYPAAMSASEAGAFDQTPSGPIVPGLDSEWLQTTIERFSRPTNFWTRYGRVLSKAANVRVIVGIPVTAVRLGESGRDVRHIEVALPDGRKCEVRARSYVIAAGGLETTRLLLASDDVQHQGIGNGSGWLGRSYMCHLSATFGLASFTGDPRRIGYGYDRDGEGVYIRRRIAVTERAQREMGLMNFTARLHIRDANDPSHGDPVLSLLYLAAFAVKYEYSRASREADRSAATYLRHLGNIVRHPFKLAQFLGGWGTRRYLASRRIPSIALFSSSNCYPLEFHCEQAPNPESRVTLAGERDALGMRRLRVDWRITELDVESVRSSYELIARELELTGTGTLNYDPGAVKAVILKAGAYGGHHSGTTRMARDASEGVVDSDCRIHGVANLYIASTSVLPTSSQANPTLTGIALALRLADHLHAADRG